MIGVPVRDLVYYLATSLDGYIAAPDGDFSAFPQDPVTLKTLFDRYPETCPAHARAALGVDGPARRFDTVIMGYRTYEPALTVGLPGGAYPHLNQIVVTHRPLPKAPNLTAISGDVSEHIAHLKTLPGRDIWLCGGADVAAQLIEHIDELQLKVNPIALGTGIPVLPFDGKPHSFQLAECEQQPGEVLLLTYRAS